MAPPRPPRAELIFDHDGSFDPAAVTAVLISREEGTIAQVMAMRALRVDAGWDHEESRDAIMSARIESGRFFKVPNRHGDGWILQRAGSWRPASGATPGVLFTLAKRA